MEDNVMGLLKPAANTSAYLKAGIQGFAGSGKSRTAAEIAIGLHKFIQSKKPIAFIDTETGSDFVLPFFKDAGIELVTLKSRSFVDLLDVTKEAEISSDIIIYDSITHFWEELVKAYENKREKKKLRVWDWGPIKKEWRQFTDLYLTSKIHSIMCGRSGWVYGDKEDEEGVLETHRVGTKMKVETDMGYEPSLLIEMEIKRTSDSTPIGSKFVNQAWILKDRFDKIQGKCFPFPKFIDFLPHIKLLNLGGDHVAFDQESNSQGLFDGPASRVEWEKRRTIALENIINELLKLWPGQTAMEKKAKLGCLESIFKTGSWTEIEGKTVEELEGGLMLIREIKKEEKINA
jgi:AAA domain